MKSTIGRFCLLACLCLPLHAQDLVSNDDNGQENSENVIEAAANPENVDETFTASENINDAPAVPEYVNETPAAPEKVNETSAAPADPVALATPVAPAAPVAPADINGAPAVPGYVNEAPTPATPAIPATPAATATPAAPAAPANINGAPAVPGYVNENSAPPAPPAPPGNVNETFATPENINGAPAVPENGNETADSESENACATPLAMESDCDICRNYFIEVRAVGFNPFSRRLKDVYGSVWAGGELEIARTWFDCWKTWFNVGYISSNGHSIPLRDPTRIDLIPLGLGINYLTPIRDGIQAYLGIGVTYNFFRETDHSPFVPEHLNSNSVGGIIKSGLTYQFLDCFYFNAFVDYTYTPISFSDFDPDGPNFVERDDIDMGGIIFGLGLGMSF